jgi:hypothetical protein
VISPLVKTAVPRVFSPAIAYEGSGATVPGVGDTIVDDVHWAGVANNSYELSPHAATVEVMCTGAGAGIIPPGLVYAGVLSQPFRRANYATYAAAIAALIPRKGMRRFTSYQLQMKPVSLSTYPLDAVEHSEFRLINGTSQVSDVENDALCPICVIIPASVSVPEFTFTIAMEWRMRAIDSSLLQSTHTHHSATPESVWNQIIGAASKTYGLVESANNAWEGLAPTISGGMKALSSVGLAFSV